MLLPYSTTQLPEVICLPSRSQLYDLTPIGMGTPDVESMTGYVMRLAEAHLVSPKMLVIHEILPLFARSFLLDSQQNFLPTFWSNNVPTLNGTQSWALDWVKTIEALTAQPYLRFLTMLPWSQVIASKTLIRRTRAWCSLCYNQWRNDSQALYEPLLWTLSCITVCRKHHCIFDTTCHVCQRTQPLLGPESRLGYCAWCQGWLGRDVVVGQDLGNALAEGDMQDYIWRANAVGELLAAGPSILVPLERTIIADKLAGYVAPFVKEGRVYLRHASPFPRETLRDLREGHTIPQLGTLLNMCSWLAISPLQFFWEDPDPARIQYSAVRPHQERGNKSANRRSADELEQLRIELEQYLADPTEPPLSLSAVARRLLCHAPFLHKRFPEQSRAISTRFSTYRKTRSAQRQSQVGEEIYEIVQTFHAEGIYPSIKQVSERMRHPRSILYPEAKVAYCKAFHDLDVQ